MNFVVKSMEGSDWIVVLYALAKGIMAIRSTMRKSDARMFCCLFGIEIHQSPNIFGKP